jgi:hypothetical protein
MRLSPLNVHGQLLISHNDGKGNHLTPQQVRFALKLQKENENKEEEFESIAKTLGIDVEALAEGILANDSPDGRRQVVRRLNASEAAEFKIRAVPVPGSDEGTGRVRKQPSGKLK